MGSDRSPELLVVAVRYISVYVFAIGPAVDSATGLDTLSIAPGGLGRAWALIPNPQGWPLCVGYLPVHYAYLFVRARLAGRSIDAYWNEYSLTARPGDSTSPRVRTARAAPATSRRRTPRG
ncbi:hypothetical protein [Halorubrum hochsteinianum]|uniref:Uncharacterized protein n=1 Tax=Halorubrum hochstenium ATCC 700873 TaxID=1227481 RepID=M0FDL1_9EURY|nr:hypothetical protein [Halorubrum hochsteinianum]ELZ57428.1 hypothetical protein C467_06749 [Halorubrum hochstenium ATCC 700873]